MYLLKSVRNVLQTKLYHKASAPGSSLASTSSRHLHDKGSDTEPSDAATTETLMDLHGRRHDYLRISLTERCNLRCQYCMPAEGVALSPRARLLSAEELLRLARVFAALGVHKLRLTGGEPTLRADLEPLVRALRALPGVRTVAMTSNGLALARRLPALQRAGLTHLNLSLDTLRADRFERMTRRPGLARVLACIDVALQVGLRPLKVNTVLMKGFNDDEVADFVEFTREREVEVRQRVGGRAHGAGAGGAGGCARARARAAAGGGRARGHGLAVGGAGPRRPPGLRVVHDAALLRRLLAPAPHGRRQPQGVPVRRRGGVAAGRAARRRRRRRPGRARARRAAPQARAARRNEKWRHIPGLQSADDSHWRIARRAYCTAAGAGAGGGAGEGGGDGGGGARLTHVDGAGRASMVDVGGKAVTERAAEAECFVHVSAAVVRLLRAGGGRKGDAAGAARLAGVMAAKRTADLIPLCHALPLTVVRVHVELPADGGAEAAAGGAVRVTCEARACARTGVEMEALTGCALAALTLYDMCKSADRHMRVTGLRVTRKSGGARGDWEAPAPAPAPADTPDTGV